MTDPVALPGYDPVTAWQVVTEKLQEELPRQSFLTWFKPIEVKSFDGKTLTLQLPTRFYYDWIESHYRGLLRRTVSQEFGDDIELAYDIASDNHKEPLRAAPLQVVVPRETSKSVGGGPTEAHLNPRYRFDNFIEGDCNRIARAAALTLARNPGGTSYNPLLIYGGSGLGKTHLMQAIGNHMVERRLAHRVLYVTSEQFTQDFVKAIQSGRIENFSRIYRKVDVLLLDDVQFFLTKDKTQEEFFHTFNYLHQSGKQLVLSSDRPPKDMDGFDERLSSRLQWGLIAELKPPEYETRLAIVNHLADRVNAPIPSDVADLVATHITANIRDLHGAVIQLSARSSLVGQRLNLDLARDVLRSFGKRVQRTISIERIQSVVAKEFNITTDQLRSRSRKKEIANARQLAMYLATELTDLTLKAIGLHFGGRDHATVIHARDCITDRVINDTAEASLVIDLRRILELTPY